MKSILLAAIIWAIAYSVPPYYVKMRELDLQEAKVQLEERRQNAAEDYMKAVIEELKKQKISLEKRRMTI